MNSKDDSNILVKLKSKDGQIFEIEDKCLDRTKVFKNLKDIMNLSNEIKVDVDNTESIGGILGRMQTGGTAGNIKYNYNIGRIEISGSKPTNISGIIGFIATNAVTRSNNYYLSGISNSFKDWY